MTTLWRISNHIDLSGEGGRGYSARWHSEGRQIVYLAESPAGAMLERIVHMTDMYEDASLPRFYQLLKVAAPDDLGTKPLNTIAPTDWKADIEFTQQIGNALAGLDGNVAGSSALRSCPAHLELFVEPRASGCETGRGCRGDPRTVRQPAVPIWCAVSFARPYGAKGVYRLLTQDSVRRGGLVLG